MIKKIANKNMHWILLLPYILLFTTFIVIPVAMAVGLSFTQFDGIMMPVWNGARNYINLLAQDDIFMRHVLPNTLQFALVVGPGGYILAFMLAWLISQLSNIPRTILAIVIYSPSLTAGTTMTVVWQVLFSGDRAGYINNLLISLGVTTNPIQFLLSSAWIMPVMMIVALWSSMGVGFLAMLAGILNTDQEVYEAAYIDGVRNRAQEIYYVTIPMMKPQMLFGAVMAIVNTFAAAGIGVQLTGANPTPGYAGQLIVNHIEDFGINRYEMGYAAAISVVLLLIIWGFYSLTNKLFREKD